MQQSAWTTKRIKGQKWSKVKKIIPFILQTVTENPNVGEACMWEEFGISKKTVQRILKEHHFHGHCVQLHQTLSKDNFVNRSEFCTWAQLFMRENTLACKYPVYWRGYVSLHTTSNFTVLKTQKIVGQINDQHRRSTNVWEGTIGVHVIEPYFSNGHLNGQMYSYSEFLMHDPLTLLLTLRANIQAQDIGLQQNGASAHFLQRVRAILNKAYKN